MNDAFLTYDSEIHRDVFNLLENLDEFKRIDFYKNKADSLQEKYYRDLIPYILCQKNNYLPIVKKVSRIKDILIKGVITFLISSLLLILGFSNAIIYLCFVISFYLILIAFLVFLLYAYKAKKIKTNATRYINQKMVIYKQFFKSLYYEIDESYLNSFPEEQREVILAKRTLESELDNA